jgi:hypothetical protein
VLHATIARHPQHHWKTWSPDIGFIADALCRRLDGHLARRKGALLRHLLLRRLGHQARLFVHLDPLLARNRRDQLPNRFERPETTEKAAGGYLKRLGSCMRTADGMNQSAGFFYENVGLMCCYGQRLNIASEEARPNETKDFGVPGTLVAGLRRGRYMNPCPFIGQARPAKRWSATAKRKSLLIASNADIIARYVQ